VQHTSLVIEPAAGDLAILVKDGPYVAGLQIPDEEVALIEIAAIVRAARDGEEWPVRVEGNVVDRETCAVERGDTPCGPRIIDAHAVREGPTRLHIAGMPLEGIEAARDSQPLGVPIPVHARWPPGLSERAITQQGLSLESHRRPHTISHCDIIGAPVAGATHATRHRLSRPTARRSAVSSVGSCALTACESSPGSRPR